MGASRFNAHFMTTTPTEMVTPTSLPLSLLNGGLSREEIEAFRRFVSQLDYPSNALSYSFAYLGIFTFALSAFSRDLGLSIQGPPTI